MRPARSPGSQALVSSFLELYCCNGSASATSPVQAGNSTGAESPPASASLPAPCLRARRKEKETPVVPPATHTRPSLQTWPGVQEPGTRVADHLGRGCKAPTRLRLCQDAVPGGYRGMLEETLTCRLGVHGAGRWCGQQRGGGSWEAMVLTCPEAGRSCLGSPCPSPHSPGARQLLEGRSPTPERPNTTHGWLQSKAVSLRWAQASGLCWIPGKSWHRPAGTAVHRDQSGTVGCRSAPT